MSALDVGLISAGSAIAAAILVAVSGWRVRRRARQRQPRGGDTSMQAPGVGATESEPPTASPPTPPSPPPAAAPEPPHLSLLTLPPAEELPAGDGAPAQGRWHIEVPPTPPPSPPLATAAASAEPPDRRYANASLVDPATGWRWARARAIAAGDLLHLRLDIGPLSAASQVAEPVPFPDEFLPPGDLVIYVVVSSSTFTVGREPGAISAASSAEDSFLLPGDGRAATAADGGSELMFVLAAPAEPGPALVRVTYYYRGAVVQSQLLSAQVDGGTIAGSDDPWSLVTDYTAAAVLATVSAIPDRPRVAVIVNGDASGHQIYVRARGADSSQPQSVAASLPPAIGDAVRQYRRVLANPPVAPTSMSQTRQQLGTALRTLAPLGWDMYAALFAGLKDVLLSLTQDDTGSVVLHVARPTGVTLSVPWALLYTIPLYQPAEKLTICPLVAQWDGHSPLLTGQPTSCPRSGEVSHASDLLCPFGFLGFRCDIEQLSSTEHPVLSISAPPGSSVVVAETAYQVDAKALDRHITTIRSYISRMRDVSTELALGKDQLKQLISRDLPLVYFFCHGERPNAASPETFLGIGNHDIVRPADLVGWIQEAYVTSHLRVWDRIRPLVFINACHSAELNPEALFNYIDVFVGGGNAAGVIGTEVRVSQDLAMEFAALFFDQLLSPGATVATALRAARLSFLAQGNIFGLNYTPYCWADLTIAS